MEFEKYVSELDSLEFSKLKSQKFEDKDLIEKKSMVIISVLGGLIGVDRYMIGDKAKGVIKSVSFASIFISIITVLTIITKKVLDYYGNVTGNITVTIKDNIAIAEKGLFSLMYALIALFVLYVAFVIFDGYLCYEKNLKNNYKILKSQIK